MARRKEPHPLAVLAGIVAGAVVVGGALSHVLGNDKERQERALEFQRVVDKLFSLGGFRGEEEDSPVRLARRFRELAGFDTDEMDELAEIAKAAREEAERLQAAAREAKVEAAAS